MPNAGDRVSTTAANDESGRRSAIERARVEFLTRMPVLEYFKDSLVTPLTCLIVVVNLTSLGLLFYYFGWCEHTTVYGTLPSVPAPAGAPLDYAPPALASLQDLWEVVVIETKLVYYSATETFDRAGGGEFWTPVSYTCGCSACTLLSCSGTIPINVEYEQYNHWFTAGVLATGALVYVNLFLTVVAILLLCLRPTNVRDDNEAPLGRDDYYRILSNQWKLVNE